VREGYGTVTVLFTDLVGSTDLLARLGEAAFDELRRAHFAALRETIGRHRGDEVKTLGDGVLAAFGSAADAVAGAVAVQQSVGRQARSTGAPLAVRVGLALGDVSFEENDVFGAPVVEAARLVAAARSGQILATSIVAMVAGGRSEAAFTDLGRLELKGLPKPVPVCEVAWEPLAEPSVPMPNLLTDVGRIFVGRDAELERLQQLWKEAAAGERRVVLLAGEPGVGKTRLAAELAARVHKEGGVVLAGRCDEDLGVPYQPFVEALRHFVDRSPPETLGDRLGRYGGELARLVPELAERLVKLPAPLKSDPETERYRLFDAMVAWLGAVSTDEPLLLVLDDLQWAAKPTLLLLRHVIRSSEARRLLVLATYRDTELGHDHPLVELLADLRRQAGVERIPLVGLDPSGVSAFVEQAAGHPLGDDDVLLARAIHDETEGNPFFVREILRHLTESGAVARQGGRWATRLPVQELGIPEGVREVVGRRLAHLSKETNGVLRMAAVVGTEFELAVLQSAHALGEEELLCALEEAADARLVLEIPGAAARYRFAHALVRDTLYDRITAARRVTLHRRVAEAIETVHAARLDDYLPALAHHYSVASAPVSDPAKAVLYGRRAGDRALAQLANDEAAAYYHHALELLEAGETRPDAWQRLELLISLGEAQRRAGDPAHRETLLEAARLAEAAGAPDALARAALANKRGMWGSGIGHIDDDRIAVLEAALVAAGPQDSTVRARLLAALADEIIYVGDRKRRVAVSDEAVAVARRVGDPATLADVLLLRQTTIMSPHTVSERLAGTAEILDLAGCLGNPALACRARLLRVRAAREAGHFEEAARCLDAAEELAEELGQPTLRWLAAANRAAALAFAGRLDAAADLVSVAARLADASGQPDALIWLAWGRFQVGIERGDLDEVVELLGDVVDRYPRVPTMRAMLAASYCEMGRFEQARSTLDVLAAEEFALPVDGFWIWGLAHCAAVSAALGDTAAAVHLRQLLIPYADQVVAGAAAVSGCVAHYLGLLVTTLGHFEEAEHHFVAAAATHARIGAPAWLARTRLEWARMLLARRQPGDTQGARELLGHALATARELSLGNVERNAAAMLQDCP
jgi:class 3 adenylate cyclase/tetratricopeptide (TPR) repeat protein